jgi:flagellar hook-length control protein FliK
VEKAVLNLKNGQNSIKIKLRPEFLGPLRMHILTENHQVMVRILTDVPWVKETIEQNIDQLKAALQNHGLQIDKFDVSVASDTHSHTSHGGEQGTPSSINLGGYTDGEEANEGLCEELTGIGQYIESTNDLRLINYFI